MKAEQAKSAIKAFNELSQDYKNLYGALKGTTNSIGATKQLWREGNKSRLIKIGVTLIMFPEPTPISETIGACFVAAGAIQKGIKSRAIYLDDLKKTFKSTLRDVLETSQYTRV